MCEEGICELSDLRVLVQNAKEAEVPHFLMEEVLGEERRGEFAEGGQRRRGMEGTEETLEAEARCREGVSKVSEEFVDAGGGGRDGVEESKSVSILLSFRLC